VPSEPDELVQLRLLHHVRDDLTLRLTGWGVLSVLAGSVTWYAGRRGGRRFLVGLGRQTAAWGAVDTVIAGVGAAANRRAVTDAPKAVASLRRLLWTNAALDVGYLVGAAAMARRRSLGGDALGVAVQAVALLVLDVWHARRLRP
jgi:hypothetical protein